MIYRPIFLLQLFVSMTLGPAFSSASEITYLSATPFEDITQEKTINPRNIGFVLLDRVLADSKISLHSQSIPTMRVHQAINRRSYPNWVVLAVETSDFKSFNDLSDKYEVSDTIFELQCAIVSHHTTTTPPYSITKEDNATLGLVAHVSEVDVANRATPFPIKFVAVKTYSHGLKMLMAGRLSYLATTVEAFALTAASARLEKSLFDIHECHNNKIVKLLFYIDNKMQPETIGLIKQKLQQAIANGTAQKVYDEFYGKYLTE
ncbi:hypothetical protein R50073_41420 [Maricurvus nonylphenolicus]|uniref:hypothetical protein n=1 Tax=Maricurvus nonylphenolicus TaxID=1008307 RepID=UPI0036F321DF